MKGTVIIMNYLWGALAGLVWGAAAALLNAFVSKKCIAKNSSGAMLAANAIRSVVDIGALAAVFLLRKLLPFSFEAALIGTAVALSMLTIVFAYRLSK